MLFEIVKDENGKDMVLNKPYHKDAHYSYKVIKENFFLLPNKQNLENLRTINHHIKNVMVEQFKNFGDYPDNVKNDPLEKMNFQQIFDELFTHQIESFKKIIYLDKDKNLVNLYDGVSLSLKDDHIKVSVIPEYNFIWEKKKEGHQKYSRRSQRKQEKLDFDINEFTNLIPYKWINSEFKNQYLFFIHTFINEHKYNVDKNEIIKSCFQYINRNDVSNTIESFEDFKNDLLFIKEHYSNVMSHPENVEKDYVLTNKEFHTINEGNLFNVLENTLSSLFYYNNNKNKRVSVFSKMNEYNILNDKRYPRIKLNKDLSLNLARRKDLENILSVYERINNHFDYQDHSYVRHETYLFDGERSYDRNNLFHHINKITYEEFLNYYQVDDDLINYCFYHYFKAYMIADEKMNLYINETVKSFVKNSEKLTLIMSDKYQKEDDIALSLDINSLNQKLSLPLNVLKILYNDEFSLEKKALCEIITDIDLEKNPFEELCFDKMEELNLAEKIFQIYIDNNKGKLLLEKIKEKNLFNRNIYIIKWVEIIEKNLNEKSLTLKNHIDINETINEIRENKKKGVYHPKEKEDANDLMHNLSFDESREIISKYIIELLLSEKQISQEEVIANINWMKSLLNINVKDISIMVNQEGNPYLKLEKAFHFSLFDRDVMFYTLLDYHLMKGNNKIVYYLKEEGLKPKFDKDLNISSLEYAIVGDCHNNIIDWICDELGIQEKHPVKVFGFLGIQVRSASSCALSNRLLETDFEKGILFGQEKEKRNDFDILKKMEFVYSKYKVDFNCCLNRLYHLIDEENKDIIINNLGLNKIIIEKIIYGIKIRDILINNNILSFKKEVEEGRLSLGVDLRNNIDNDDELVCNSGVLNFLNSYVDKYRFYSDMNAEKNLEIYIRTLLKNTDEKDIQKYSTFEKNDNLFELVMKNGVRLYENLIREMVLNYGLNLKDGKEIDSDFMLIVNNVHAKKEFKSYKEIYFSKNDYEKNLFDQIISDVEKIKIESVLEKNESGRKAKKRI